MAVSLLKVIADLNLSLASAVSVGTTTATLQVATDGEGVALPSGKYGFTIDGDNTAKEFVICDLVGTALTNVQHVSVQGAVTTGFSNYHRVGAVVTITDWAIFSRILNNLTGVTGFDAGAPLGYDAQPSLSDPLSIPTVQFVLDTASGGPVTFDATVIAGDAGETIADGEWVYFNTTDGLWYKTDADDTAKCLNVQIGKARGAGTTGNAITGGIFVAGLEKVGVYVAGTTYYLSNTAGALSTSAGTNSVVVGVGDANTDLILRKPTPSQVDAMQGGSTFGTPSNANKFLTQDYNASATGLPIVRTYTTASSSIGSSTTQFDITNPSGTTFRYTWNSTGTDPNITSVTVPTGSLVDLRAQNFAAGNQGVFTVTSSGTNYFEVTNASGVAESNKTIGTGYIVISGTNFWTKPTGLKYIVVEGVGAGNGGGSQSSSNTTGGGGGGGGGYFRKVIAAASLSATVPYIVGQAGAVQSNAPALAGRATIFGTTLIANGATVATNKTDAAGGGSATGGDINLTGNPGNSGRTNEDAGDGGASFFAGAGRGAQGNTTHMTAAAANSGSGGGGAGEGTGAAGGDGQVILTEYYS